jgi:putative membrane protein
VLLILAGVALGVSAINPFDGFTWWLEVAPVLIGAPILVLTYRRLPLTPLIYRLLLLHALILILGGHYSYARVPLGFWVQDWFDLARNHYDRLGHFAQGFIPALLLREVLVRTSPLKPGKWTFAIVSFMCLGFSALYELIEWWTAVGVGDASTDFLGTQGDVWDAQWDMALAFAGAILAQLSLGWLQDRQIKRLSGQPSLTPHSAP